MLKEGIKSYGLVNGVLALIQFLVVYSLWRLYMQAKRLKKYVAQFSLPLCDIAASIYVKFLYVGSFKGGYPDETYNVQFAFLLIMFACWVVLPIMILAVWIVFLIRSHYASRKLDMQFQLGGMAQKMAAEVTITDIAHQNGCFCFLVYLNFFCVVILVIADIICTWIKIKEWDFFDTLPLLTIVLIIELVDFLLNSIEDLILKCYAKTDPGALFRFERPLPGLTQCGIVNPYSWMQGANENFL